MCVCRCAHTHIPMHARTPPTTTTNLSQTQHMYIMYTHQTKQNAIKQHWQQGEEAAARGAQAGQALPPPPEAVKEEEKVCACVCVFVCVVLYIYNIDR